MLATVKTATDDIQKNQHQAPPPQSTDQSGSSSRPLTCCKTVTAADQPGNENSSLLRRKRKPVSIAMATQYVAAEQWQWRPHLVLMFHSCSAPWRLPSSTLFRYVLGCIMADTSKVLGSKFSRR